jgi:hypothetical protein
MIRRQLGVLFMWRIIGSKFVLIFLEYHLQQSFFLTKIALNIFQKKFPIDFIAVIYLGLPVSIYLF